MTNAEIVSRIQNDLNSVSKDAQFRKRHILHVARKKAAFLISTKLSDRSLYREDNLYTPVDCFELVSQDLVKCDIVEFRRCKHLMKSKKRIPGLVYSKYGNSLKEVTAIDGEKNFLPTTPAQYRLNKQRVADSSDTDSYFYLKDGYLYLPDTKISRVNLYVLSLETEKLEALSECNTKTNCCKSLWDYEFVIPDKLQEVVISETLKELSMKKQIPADENPNMNSNEK